MKPLRPANIEKYLNNISMAEQVACEFFSEQNPLTIFDIGACEGEDSIRFAKRFPKARVYTFEPLPANQEIIRVNFLRYGITNARTFCLALSDQSGSATFHVSSGRPPEEYAGKEWNYGNKSSSLLRPAGDDPMYGWIKFNESIKVSTQTLDDFCRIHDVKEIDFIHMDVQGAEYLVLQGAQASLPHIKSVWLEVSNQQLYQGQKLKDEIETFMHTNGFAMVFMVQREIEGDQFYINLRYFRNRLHFGKIRLRRWIERARFALGAKRSLFTSMVQSQRQTSNLPRS